MIYCECNGDAQLALFNDDEYGEANNADEDRGCSPEESKPDRVPPLSSNPLEFLLPCTFRPINPLFVPCAQLYEFDGYKKLVENSHTPVPSGGNAPGNEDPSRRELVIERSEEYERKKAKECGVPEKPNKSGIWLRWCIWMDAWTHWYRNMLAMIISNGAPYKLYKFPKIWLTLLASPLIKLTIFPISAPAMGLPPKSKEIYLMPRATSDAKEKRHALLFFPFPTCSKTAFLILIFRKPPGAFAPILAATAPLKSFRLSALS